MLSARRKLAVLAQNNGTLTKDALRSCGYRAIWNTDVPTYTITVYEVDSSYYSDDGRSLVLSQDVLSITDSGDDQLHRTVAEDPGNNQIFDFANEPSVTGYTVQYLDFAQVNGTGPSYELYAMEVSFVGGATKYYVMSKDEDFNPQLNDEVAITSFSSFTSTDYGQIGAAVCYAAGTQILTRRGSVPVETIQRGDAVQTKDGGYHEVLWVNARHFGPDELSRYTNIRPILIKPSGAGDTGPILVSPQHRLLVTRQTLGSDLPEEECFIKAKLLAEYFPGRARVARGKREVSYHHFLLAKHAVVFADGFESESFLPGATALRGITREDRRRILPYLAAPGCNRPRDHTYGYKLSRPELKRKDVVEMLQLAT